MTQQPIDVRVSGPNALWVEDKGHDVGAGGDAGISNVVNDANGESLGGIFGPGFSKELPRAASVDIRSLNDNIGNATLVR